ncbi:hypothetical protein MGYG_03552 [Nannizzia gypsea CBS 118893]|uniref:Kinetochore protein fta4 n=1 Tax=Arthroderma gypseum (strain ATCC MYA-4604 / CBS 118893) TaxID=535722 RepID=E4USN3_ARTGP|nr:hypothetical protein MGYG_03552 [Nannizzia gypsea CBS 118893]EFR00548.1 hypothetical protein MGYG_03552 [Nannizzia gypsea CBS 118893]
MGSSRTISEAKLGFLRDQVRVLSAPLNPSPDWHEYGPVVEDGIGDKAIGEVLQKFNTLLKQHNRAVFSTQAIHHVSQQIERLYWNSINPEFGEEGSRQPDIDKGADLTNSRNISRLPDEWPEDGMNEEDKSRYNLLRERLISLDAERKKKEDRLLQYKRLKSLLEPFEDPMNTIQPNLATRDGELGAELDRMRMLLAKVASKVGRLQSDNQSPEKDPDAIMDTDEKLARLLDMT